MISRTITIGTFLKREKRQQNCVIFNDSIALKKCNYASYLKNCGQQEIFLDSVIKKGYDNYNFN